jgi:hypothetical protein
MKHSERKYAGMQYNWLFFNCYTEEGLFNKLVPCSGHSQYTVKFMNILKNNNFQPDIWNRELIRKDLEKA